MRSVRPDTPPEDRRGERRGAGFTALISALFLLAAFLCLRVGGWLQIAAYLLGLWGAASLAMGLHGLLMADRRTDGRR
jgi:hypothetical protein